MQFKERSTDLEIIDNLSFSDPRLLDNLQDMAWLNKWLGYHLALCAGLQKIYCRYQAVWPDTTHIIDLGCGGGDALRASAKWLAKHKRHCQLVGMDANERVVQYARQQSQDYAQVDYVVGNMLHTQFDKDFDIVMLNHICHHLDNDQLVSLLKQVVKHCRLAVIINDLHRHPLAYVGIKCLASMFNLSPVTRHDGPLSVLRAFRRDELEVICNLVNPLAFDIAWQWPFHWQVILWCKA